MEERDRRWGVYLDVEGFRSILACDERRALQSLSEMMRAIFRIGRQCYPDSPEAISAHQFGDGFIVMSTAHEPCLDRCAVIAIAVMRHMAGNGGYAKAAIVEGGLADIRDCYPPEVLACREGDSHRISLVGGLMTMTTVMGSALTSAVRLAEEASGPLLLVGAELADRFDEVRPWLPVRGKPMVASHDWVHLDSESVRGIQAKADLASPSPRQIEDGLVSYCANDKLTAEWKAGARDHLGVPVVGDRA